MIIMIGNGPEGIKTLTSMIGKTVVKLVWIFPILDFFKSSQYLFTDLFPYEKQV